MVGHPSGNPWDCRGPGDGSAKLHRDRAPVVIRVMNPDTRWSEGPKEGTAGGSIGGETHFTREGVTKVQSDPWPVQARGLQPLEHQREAPD